MDQLLKTLTVLPAIPKFRDNEVDNWVCAGITPIPSSFIGPPPALAFEACSNNPAGKKNNFFILFNKDFFNGEKSLKTSIAI